MLSRGFKVVSPKTFEIDVESIEAKEGDVIVKVENAAVCKADLRYYLGQRDERILGLKYPMRLIHEATGIVLKDFSGKFKSGDSVVLVPNICDSKSCDFKHINNPKLGANYCPKAKFASSNHDGFSSELVCINAENAIAYDRNIIDSNIAVFSELTSVAIAAIRRVSSLDNKRIGIWGDGILGYILAQTIKAMGSNVKTVCVGRHTEKLEMFQCDEMYIANEIDVKSLELDIAFECIGGSNAANGINEMLEHVDFGGEIVLTGVSDQGALINTRRILEKAISITGSTRSTIEDFKKALEMLKDEEMINKYKKLILSEKEVSNISDYYNAFEMECSNRKLGKNIIKFNL